MSGPDYLKDGIAQQRQQQAQFDKTNWQRQENAKILEQIKGQKS